MSLLKRIYSIINAQDAKIDENTKAKLKEIERQYNALVKTRGAKIENVIRIGRHEKMHYLLEDADFSQYRIKKLIIEGEEDTKKVLQG